MPRTPDAQIPASLQKTLEEVLVSDSMGIRFRDQKKFRSSSIIEIQKIFLSVDSAKKMQILLFLRECARSLYIMPAYLPAELGKIPSIHSSASTDANFCKALQAFSKNELALPSFHLSDENTLNDLFTVWMGIFSIEYRGPLFFYKTGTPSDHERQMGVLNLAPSQTHLLDVGDLEACVHSLKSLQWFRNRLLSLTEPWMYAGIFY